MAEYHGDLMYRTGKVYKGVDDTNYIVAIVIAAFLGATGAHRFYMNDHKIA
ncbi:NINE protein [Alteriqipengyuania flavescens]|uniref:NINE protein n=1 Tax=Alteriqipengyuania flavescens TaxID=3053610 RepID=UPI0025B3B7D2|nr:NINE protein [Alteriqipengyuania flavescens]WJY18371.1 NINE protein [Alteriqipengyuania flavescens]WJY24312.1 NINE protein [Alteriqipengyuania flavescens]